MVPFLSVWVLNRGLVRNRKFQNVLFWHRGGIRRLVLRGFSLAGPGNAARRPFCGPGMATDWRGGIIDFQQFFSISNASHFLACPVSYKAGRLTW